MVTMTDWDNDEAREFLKRRLKGKGIDEKLAELGAEEGDEVEIAGRVFEYVPEAGHGGAREKEKPVG
jgi:Obg family GTPase CgtA-like protein